MTVRDGTVGLRLVTDAEGASVAGAVREHLEHLLTSTDFDGSSRSRQFLRYVVDEVLAGRGDQLHQASIAVAVFGRKPGFDPVLDPIVRVQAGRLRRSLERYYLLTRDSGVCRIELPKGSYAPVFVNAAIARSTRQTSITPGTWMEAPSDYWPAILIHPFAVDSDEDEFVVARIQDELAQELCLYGDLRVMRAHELDRRQQAEVRFELRGVFRRRADDCLIGARLVDRATGQQLWGEERHTAVDDRWFGNVDDVARAIAARVGSEYGVVARVLAGDYAAGRLDPGLHSTAIARCYHFFYARQVNDIHLAIEALHELTTRAPEIGLAWVYLARLYIVNRSFELTALKTPPDAAIRYAYQGVLLDPSSARARCILATALILDDEVSAALDELERARRLNPDSLAYREINGWLTALAGDWERGIALVSEAMMRNPYPLPHVNHGIWLDHLRHGDFEAAHRAALEYRDSAWFWRELMIACCRGHLGRTTEARTNVAELLHAKPQFRERGRALIGYYVKPAELRELVIEGLAKAGLALS